MKGPVLNRRAVEVGGVALLSALLLSIQVDLLEGRTYPVQYCDELGYMAHAAQLTRFDWSGALKMHGYFTFGSALFMLPSFLAFSQASSIYHSILLTNALLASLILPIAYVLGRRFAPDGSRRTVALASLAVCCYPTLLVFPGIAWSETILAFLYWLSVLVLLGMANRGPSSSLSLVFGILTGLMYGVHHRSLGILAAATCTMAYLLYHKACSRRGFALFFSPLGLAALGAAALDRHQVQALWSSTVDVYFAGQSELQGLFTLHGLRKLAVTAAGQMYYLGGSTYLFLFFGLLAALGLLRRAPRELDQTSRPAEDSGPETALTIRAVTLYVTLTSFTVFCMSVVQSVFMQFREKYLASVLHGRYHEAFLGPLLLLGLLMATGQIRRGISLSRGILLSAGLLVYSGYVLLYLGQDELRQPFGYLPAITGLLPYRTPEWRLDIRSTSMSILATAGLVLLLLKLRPRLGLLGLAGVFAWSASENYKVLITAAAEHWRDEGAITDWLREHVPPGVVYFLKRADRVDTGEPCHYQFALPQHRIEVTVDPMDLGRLSPYMIYPGRTPVEVPSGAWLLAQDEARSCSLWVLNGPQQQDLAQQGVEFLDPKLVFNAGADLGQLLPVAYRSKLEVLQETGPIVLSSGLWSRVAARVSGSQSLRLRITHTGTDSAWPPSVRLGVLWLDPGAGSKTVGEQRVVLPRRLRPGQSLEVDVPLRPVDAEGWPLPSGRYELGLGLVQENITWFYSQGDGLLKVPVTIEE